MQTQQTEDQALAPQEFDHGISTAGPDIYAWMTKIQHEFRSFGVDIEQMNKDAKTVSQKGAPKLIAEIHDTATILFTQWKNSRAEKEDTKTLALARLLNGLTYCGRTIDERHNLFNLEYFDELEVAVKEIQHNFEPAKLAKAVDAAAHSHTHEQAWAWVVLPTFAKQPYGRILHRKIDLETIKSPVFVTQPFFINNRAT
ncbi:MAG: hypothetical protein N2D54_10490, partial [Chloroflexota bacterium]